jgi:hypothetical protein
LIRPRAALVVTTAAMTAGAATEAPGPNLVDPELFAPARNSTHWSRLTPTFGLIPPNGLSGGAKYPFLPHVNRLPISVHMAAGNCLDTGMLGIRRAVASASLRSCHGLSWSWPRGTHEEAEVPIKPTTPHAANLIAGYSGRVYVVIASATWSSGVNAVTTWHSLRGHHPTEFAYRVGTFARPLVSLCEATSRLREVLMQKLRRLIVGTGALIVIGSGSALANVSAMSLTGSNSDSHGDAVASAARTNCPHGARGVHGACVSAIASSKAKSDTPTETSDAGTDQPGVTQTSDQDQIASHDQKAKATGNNHSNKTSGNKH